MVFGRYFRRNCRQKACPTCFEGWAAAESERALIRLASYVSGPVEVERLLLKTKIEKRLKPKRIFHEVLTFHLEVLANRKGMRAIHVVLSPPEGAIDETAQGYRKGRQLAYDIARYSGLKGGLCVFHPYRLRCSECGSKIDDYGKRCSNCGGQTFLWFWSPHFHFLGYGWIQNTVEGFERHGWVVINLGVRKSVFWTVQYLLSHAGVSGALHTVTWFGQLAYNVLGHVPVLGAVRELCPYCGRVLMPLQWIGGTDRGPPAVDVDALKKDPFLADFLADQSEWRVV
jgi:RNA polymerase subunit RPABC4/transcription elongation factor Spt4